MKIYVAGGFGHWRAVREIQRLLEIQGHLITYDWTQAAEQVEHGTPEPRSAWPAVAKSELLGVMDAEMMVVRLPGASGTHAELGAALASSAPVVLAYAGDLPDCIAYHHPLVTLVRSLDPVRIVRALDSIADDAPGKS